MLRLPAAQQQHLGGCLGVEAAAVAVAAGGEGCRCGVGCAVGGRMRRRICQWHPNEVERHNPHLLMKGL
jgi:hypothetical protein